MYTFDLIPTKSISFFFPSVNKSITYYTFSMAKKINILYLTMQQT